MIWTDEQVTQLRDLWTAGMSTVKIARQLGITKNSVVGKSHRLDLDGRPSPIVRGGKPTPRIDRPAPVRVTLPALVSAPVQTPVAPKPAPKPAVVWVAPKRVTVPSHERCTWLDGDRPRTFRQCTAPVVEHGSWCAHHRAIVFPGSARRDAARRDAA